MELHIKTPGRPQVPLLVGQKRYIRAAYMNKESLSAISIAIRAALPRVRRYLCEEGIYTPRTNRRPPERAEAIAKALEEYIAGERVTDICATISLNPAELYRELHQHGIQLRTKAKKEGSHGGH